MTQPQLAATFAVAIVGMVCAVAIYDHQRPSQCLEEKTVRQIVSVQYRSATVEFDDGTRMDFTQTTLAPGMRVCTAVGRK